MKIPDIGVDVVEVVEILVQIGDMVKQDDSLVTIEGEKVSMEIPSTSSGVIKSILVHVGQKVKTGSSIVVLDVLLNDQDGLNDSQEVYLNDVGSENKVSVLNRMPLTESSNEKEVLVHATPIIRRLSRQLNIDLKKIVGSGRKGRILKEDVMLYAKKVLKEQKDDYAVKDNNLTDCIKSDSNELKQFKELRLTNIQIASGKNLSKSWSIIPHVTQFDESDITDLEEFRKNYNSRLCQEDISSKLTILVFIMKVVAKLLKEFPKFNSVLCVNTKKKLILNKHINIGIAVDTKNGLLVPVIKDVNNKDLVELSIELNSLSNKSKLGILSISNMTGGSFTISNLGGIGGTGFTPIINNPEVAILGVSQALIKPYWNKKEFEPRLMLPLSLSYDHRVIDGAEAVRFMTGIKKLLSDIRLLMI
ncbi:MAG: 2-oxo acid dehydrogenase subunit E2 [Buchnera aphidicola (Meitanaphis elongallis)]